VSYERGTVIAGKYRVERVIGQGGMGVVLAARHLGLDEMVAVKLIREERAEGTEALARFQREARAAARIKNEHVARVLDVDRVPEGAPYIVMELIDGTDLHALVARRGPLPPDEAVTYITQACEGLAEAHALGMVHRDLKLKNLFLTKRRDGRPLIKVIDFGVVKFSPLGDDDDPALNGSTSQLDRQKAREATLTGAAVLVGSVHYMAPEQIRASNVVNAQADVWSLGVCLYAMLTGSLPFEGETVAAVCAAIQGRPPRDVRELAPGVPAEIAAAVMRALEKDVRRRFANVAELAAAIAPHGPDHAAPSRIEAILRSDVRPPAFSPTASLRPDGGSTITSDVGVAGRVESTIDAAAVGSLASHPAPPTSLANRRRWVTAFIVALGAGATALGVWGRPATRPQPAAPEPTSTSSSMAAAAAAPVPAPSPVPVPSSLESPAPTLSLPSSSAPLPAPVPPPAVRRRAPKPAASSPQPAASPKTEPSSAYDHF
jgi:serine/threonine-protein kinase